jgi:hypothetical protein
MLDLEGVGECPNDFQTASAGCRQRRPSDARLVGTKAFSRAALPGVLYADLNGPIIVEGHLCPDGIFPVVNRIRNELPKHQFVDGEVSRSVAFSEKRPKFPASRAGGMIILFLEPPPFGHAELFP